MVKFRTLLVLAILLLLLVLRFIFFYHNQTHFANGQYVDFETTLYSEPTISGNYQTLSANLATTDKIFIKTTLFPRFHYQDTVHISGTVKLKELDRKRTVATIYFPKIETVKKDKNIFLSLTDSIRQKTIFLFSKTLPFPSSSLLLGIVFGIKDYLPKDFQNDLRVSGVLHVVAASGMNVTMVGAFVSSIFLFFLNRQIAIAISILVIVFYAFLSGLEPSILRASIMGILVFSAQILGKQNLASYGLFLAGYIMLFINPLIIFDVGFQLSFFATFGLLHLKPIFDKYSIIKKFGRIMGGDIATTIVAQLSTLPILLANFGAYSYWAIIVNGLVLWTIPVLMAIGGLGAIAGIILEPIGKLILYLSIPLLFYFQKAVEIFGGFKGSVTFSQFPWQFGVGYYLLLLAIIKRFKRNIK